MTQVVLRVVEPTREELIARVRALVALAQTTHTDSSSWVIRPTSLDAERLEQTPDMAKLQELVGGWLTTASSPWLPGFTMFIHDEALMVESPEINLVASLLYNTGHPICGTVVLVPNAHA